MLDSNGGACVKIFLSGALFLFVYWHSHSTQVSSNFKGEITIQKRMFPGCSHHLQNNVDTIVIPPISLLLEPTLIKIACICQTLSGLLGGLAVFAL